MATCKDFDTSSDQIIQLCSLCDSNVSDGYCDECEDYMCQTCFDLHSRVRMCRHHVLLDSTCQQGNKKAYSEPCTRHPIHSVKFYCVAHKIVGCVECFFPEHRNCHYQNIEDAVKIFQDSGEDTRLKREIHRLENEHSEYTKQYEEDKETVAVINNTVVNDVKSFTESVTSYVAQVEKHMLEKSERLRIENETRLERQSDDLHSVGTEIEKCKMKLENEDRVDRLFISSIEIRPVIEKLMKKIASIGRQHVGTKYEFQPNKLIMEMTNGSGSFGEICILPEPVFKQHDVSNDSHGVEVSNDVQEEDANSKTESIPPPTKAIVESMSISPEENLNNYQKEIRNRIEKENGNVAAEIPLKSSPIAKKKSSFQLKRVTGRKFCLIKSDAWLKPFKYIPQSEEVFIDEEEDLLYDGDLCFAIFAENGNTKLDKVVDVNTTNTTPVKTTSEQDHSAAADNIKPQDTSKATSQDDNVGSCVRDCDGFSCTHSNSGTSKLKTNAAMGGLTESFIKMNLYPQADSKGEPNQHTGNKIFPVSDAGSNKSSTIKVCMSHSMPPGKDTCHTFACKDMDIFLRWNLVLRNETFFKQIEQKYKKLDIARKDGALIVKVPNEKNCSQEIAFKIASRVVDYTEEVTEVYISQAIPLDSDDSEKILSEIRKHQISKDQLLFEVYDKDKDVLWVLCHSAIKVKLMQVISHARQNSQQKHNSDVLEFRMSYFLHNILSNQRFLDDFKLSNRNVAIAHTVLESDDNVLVILRCDCDKDVRDAKQWLYDKCELDYSFVRFIYKLDTPYSFEVSRGLVFKFLSMTFEGMDIDFDINESTMSIWIWSPTFSLNELGSKMSNAKRIIESNEIVKKVSLHMSGTNKKTIIEKLGIGEDKDYVEIRYKGDEVMIIGLCYIVDKIIKELEKESKFGPDLVNQTPPF